VHAIRTVATGDALLHPNLTRRLLDRFCQGPRPGQVPDDLAGLTSREIDILRFVAHGHSNSEIAGELFLSESTVKTHLAHILAKLALRDRVQAVVMAFKSGLVTPGS